MVLLLATLAMAADQVIPHAAWAHSAWWEGGVTADRKAIELGATLRWDAGAEVEVGARRLFGHALVPWSGFELYGAARAAPALGPWRPAVGLELGLTGALNRDWSVDHGEEWGWAEEPTRAHADPVYLAVQIEPLRARIGPVVAGLGEISMGSTLPSWGRVVRLELTWVRLGVAL